MAWYNHSLRFYKKYYDGIDWTVGPKDANNKRKFEQQNRKLLDANLPARILPPEGDETGPEPVLFGYPDFADNAFELVTVYPGLIIGTGITHGSGREGEIKIGFYFDHTTGMPVIAGSAVKGTLRSVFPLGLEKEAAKLSEDKPAEKEEKERLNEKAGWLAEYIAELLVDITKNEQWTTDHVRPLEKWLFGSYEHDEALLPMSGRIIFHDALPVSTDFVKIDGQSSDRYLGDDFITPHKHPLRDPVPIQFLKVLPGVKFRFQFALHAYQAASGLELSKKNMRKLFSRILLDIGIGAKTNVGYGQLVKPNDYLRTFFSEAEQRARYEAEKEAKKAKKWESIPENYFLIQQPEFEDTLTVYARVLALSDKEREKEEKKPENKRRKRIEVLQTEQVRVPVGNKWDKSFYSFEAGTIVKVTIRLGDRIQNNGIPIATIEGKPEKIDLT